MWLWIGLLLVCTTPADAAAPRVVTEGEAAPSQDVMDILASVDRANAGDAKGAVKLLDAVIARSPGHQDARVMRGIQHYLARNVGGAKTDLPYAFTASASIETSSATENFTETTTTTYRLDLGSQRALAASMLVVLLVREGELPEAKLTLKRAKEQFGAVPDVVVSDARVLFAEGDRLAWDRARAAIDRGDGSHFVQGIVSEMAGLDSAHVPEDVFAWLERSQRWTTPYNRAVGQLARQDAHGCAETIDAALVGFPEHPELLGLGYKCAARSDLVRADRWLVVLGGAKKAAPVDVIAHAERLAKGGDTHAVEVLLTDLPRKLLPEDARRVASLELDLMLTTGRVEQAARRADGTAPDADARVAHALLQMGEYSEARRILERACPKLEGGPGFGQCAQLLEFAIEQE